MNIACIPASKLAQKKQKEVKLQWGFIRDNIELIIEGRTDGIIKESNNVIIEEIKSV